jgi:hypothetical protein
MEKAKVYYSDLRTSPTSNLLDKMERLLKRAGIEQLPLKDSFAAIKIHFGEPGNLAYLRPNYAARMATLLRSLGAKPFLTDCNTLYSGRRANAVDHLQSAMENGFNPISAQCQVIIGDGLKGTDYREIPLNGEYCPAPKIGTAIADADIVISMNHFKGHEQAGFGGALKNLGMGCASVGGKLELHCASQPKIDEASCIGCNICVKPQGRNRLRQMRRLRTVRSPLPARRCRDGSRRYFRAPELQDCGICPRCRYGQAPFPHQLHHERISRMRLLEPQRCRHRARPRHSGFGRPGCTGQGMCRYGHPSPDTAR